MYMLTHNLLYFKNGVHNVNNIYCIAATASKYLVLVKVAGHLRARGRPWRKPTSAVNHYVKNLVCVLITISYQVIK